MKITLLILLFLLAYNSYSYICPNQCNDCSRDGSTCYTCQPGYSILNGLCLKNVCNDSNCNICDVNGGCFSCNLNYRVNQNQGCSQIKCGANCSVCFDNPIRCGLCMSGFILVSGRCQ